ncbi:MAG: response regulator [Planctomycetes bacterium]|nr:response regulator [Planctomycetota bacterium]
MSGPTLLLIDDAPADRALATRELLRHLPTAIVQEVGDPQALEAALGGPAPDAVVTDYRLRWSDGLAVVRAVKAGWGDCPVVMFTDSGSEEVAVAALKAGADDYVVKSARPGLGLARAVEGALARARARRREAADERERERLVAALRQALDARDAFLQAASHELRNPLNSLVLQLEALARIPELRRSEAVRLRVARARTFVDGLVAIIEDLIDMAQLGAGALELEPEPLDLVAVTREAVGALGEELRRQGCEVRLEAPAALEGRWDRRRLGQVIRSLLSNAVKFAPGRPIDVRLSAGPGAVTIGVEDRGIGVAPADQERIFGRFERAVSERHHAGFGLGLWIARELVTAMGGGIELASVPGQGSTFTVTLPRAAAADPPGGGA